MGNRVFEEPYIYLALTGVFYFLIIILPYLIFGFYFTYGIISIPDMFDILFYPTIMGFLLLQFGRKSKIDNFTKDLYFFFLLIHIYGSGFHWASNAIHETIRNMTPSDTLNTIGDVLNYAYFLDEVLSHKIFFYAFFVMLIIAFYWSFSLEEHIDSKFVYFGDFSSIIGGFSFAISLIEGQTAIEGALFAVLLAFLFIMRYDSFKDIYGRPTARYLFILSTTMIAVFMIYLAIFGSFIEPSQVLG